MKRLLIFCLIIMSLLSCGGGKHEPVVPDPKLGDSATHLPYDSLHIPGTDSVR